MQGHIMAMPAQSSYERRNFNAFKIAFIILRLIRNDYIKVGASLAEQTCQNNCQARFAPISWNKYIYQCHKQSPTRDSSQEVSVTSRWPAAAPLYPAAMFPEAVRDRLR